jgi:hypothetical protein
LAIAASSATTGTGLAIGYYVNPDAITVPTYSCQSYSVWYAECLRLCSRCMVSPTEGASWVVTTKLLIYWKKNLFCFLSGYLIFNFSDKGLFITFY